MPCPNIDFYPRKAKLFNKGILGLPMLSLNKYTNPYAILPRPPQLIMCQSKKR